MKKALTSFFSYARTERLGFAIVVLVLIPVIVVRATMSLWVHPPSFDKAQRARMAAAYASWKAKEDASGTAASSYAEGSSEIPEGTFFAFDPNTLDSTGFIQLGMPARAVKGLLNWRRKGKHFYKPEDLRPLYNLPEDVYVRLEPYIRIDDSQPGRAQGYAYNNSFPAIPAIIDLNTADSATLDRGVPGIGATLSHKILQHRAALGGFIKHEQLLEVYKFPDTTFRKMRDKLRINPETVRKISLNSATLAQMTRHPYVGEAVAKNILLYREGIKHYERVEQLRQVPLMNEEIYRKIAPYFVVD